MILKKRVDKFWHQRDKAFSNCYTCWIRQWASRHLSGRCARRRCAGGDKFHTSLLSLSSDVAQPRILPQDNYRTLIPQGVKPLVNQTAMFVYYRQGDEALRIYENTYLRRIYWVETYSTRYLTNSPEKRFVSATSTLSLTNGWEANVELGVSASFKGLGVSFGAGYRTFWVQETESHRKARVYHSTSRVLVRYQRHYEFEDEFWWTLDAWNVIQTMGSISSWLPKRISLRSLWVVWNYRTRSK